MLLYLPAYNTGFVLDIVESFCFFKNQSFTDYINRVGIENQSLYQTTQVLLWMIFKLFGNHPLPWFLMFTFLHAVNANLVTRVISRLLEKADYRQHFEVSILAAILFLISPLQAEVLVWKASLHYLTGLMMILLILHWTISFFDTQQNKFIGYILGLYFVSTFSLEIFYLTPAFVLLISSCFFFSKIIDNSVFKQILFKVFLPMVFLWILHLILLHFVYHRWIGHYKIDLAEAFSFQHIVTQISKFFFHILSMEYFWRYEWRSYCYQQLESTITVKVVTILLLSFMVFAIWKRPEKIIRIFTLFLLLSLLSFSLIIPFWFNDLQFMRNDRYYYLPSVFVFCLMSFIFFAFKKQRLRNSLMVGYVAICIWGTLTITLKAKQSGKVFNQLIQGYCWQEKPLVILLNQPDNFEGIGMLPARVDFFKTNLTTLNPLIPKGIILDVLSYNMTSPYDGAHVRMLNDSMLTVTLNQWGSWWWWGGSSGLVDENEFYKLNLSNSGHEYTFTLKRKYQNAVLMFQKGDRWKEVNKTVLFDQW